MIQFLVKRFIGLIFVIFGVTFITFTMGFYAPSDPIKEQLGQHFTQETYDRIRHQYGLDRPFFEQYWDFTNRLLHFDLGTSFHFNGRSVNDMLAESIPISFELALWGLLLTFLIGVPVGIWSALRANTWIDTTNMGVALILYALPSFVIAVFAQVLIVNLNISLGIPSNMRWPASGWTHPWSYGWNDLRFKLVPIIVYALAGYAYISRLARTSMVEVLRQDFVRTARAKGLRERAVVYRHAFRNALIPLVTVFGLSVGLLVAGTFFIEQIFNIPGIGRQTLGSVTNFDYPVIQATTILIATGVVAGNLISDLLYSVVDPRIKVQ